MPKPKVRTLATLTGVASLLASSALAQPSSTARPYPLPREAYDGARPATQPLPAAPEFVRTSQYVTVRDGTRLAIDILRPARNGVVSSERLPVILQATPYQRAVRRDGRLVTAADQPHLGALLASGYVIASLDIRGRGASFGEASSGDTGSDADRYDLYDIIEWLAVQPWSSGAIGMAGCSYVGRTVYWAASALPPHLKAVVPCSAPLDNYESVMRPGGVNQTAFLTQFDQMMRTMDSVGVAVDEDTSGALLKQAIASRAGRWTEGRRSSMTQRALRPWRDTPAKDPAEPHSIAFEWNYASNFAIGRTPVLQFAGWRDLFPQDSIRWRQLFASMGLPQKIIIGPWYHCVWYAAPGTPEEHVRWFDRYLKGLQNGVDGEPSIRYLVMGAPAGQEWREANEWPLPDTTAVNYFLVAGSKGAKVSVNSGGLADQAPSVAAGADIYKVDYTVTTTGLNTRWNIPRSGAPQLDTRELDGKSLTYTSAPFKEGAEFTGSPVLNLWVESTTANPDFYAYVSIVDPDGKTMLVTDGQLRASNRTLRTPPWPNAEGLPWHGGYFSDASPLSPGKPAKLEFALFPTSFYVKQGQRIRVTINNFDKGNFDTPVEPTSPTVRILRDAAHPSAIILPRRKG